MKTIMNDSKVEKSMNIKITNKKQFEVMVEWMERHPLIARGRGHYGTNKMIIKEKIEELAAEVNNYGPPIRLAEEWLRVWINFKSNLKRKMVNNKSISLSPLEEAAANFIKSDNSLCPADMAFISIKQDNETDNEDNDNDNDNDNENDNDNDNDNDDMDNALEESQLDIPKQNREDSFRKRRTAINMEELRYEALQEQLSNQRQIIDKLTNIEANVKESLYIKKRNLKLREEIVKIKKRKLEILERQNSHITKK